MLVIWLLTTVNNIFFTMIPGSNRLNVVNGLANEAHTIFILPCKPVTNHKQKDN